MGKKTKAGEDALPSVYREMQVTARVYLSMGYKKYRAMMGCDLAPYELSSAMLAKIRRGMRQVLQGQGLTPGEPLTGLDIDGFNAMAHVMSLQTELQSLAAFVGKTRILDELTMVDAVTEERVVLYNLVPAPECRRRNATLFRLRRVSQPGPG